MTGWLLLLGALAVSVAVSVTVMSLLVGYPFDWTRGKLHATDELLDRVNARVRAGEDHGDALLDELRRPR